MWVFGVTSTNFVNLTYLVAACNILHLLCLPFLALVPRTIDPVARSEFQPSGRSLQRTGGLERPCAAANQCSDGRTSFGIGFFACTVPDSALGFVAEPHQQVCSFETLS